MSDETTKKKPGRKPRPGSKPKTADVLLTTYARHKHVVERYRYLTEVKRRRTDDVDYILQYEEVFLDPATIMRIIKKFKVNPEREKQLKELKIKHNPKK